jgi:hypothetical protein
LGSFEDIVFSWQALLERLSTRANLLIRRMIYDEEAALCLACGPRLLWLGLCGQWFKGNLV